jgi:hypothetical protein
MVVRQLGWLCRSSDGCVAARMVVRQLGWLCGSSDGCVAMRRHANPYPSCDRQGGLPSHANPYPSADRQGGLPSVDQAKTGIYFLTSPDNRPFQSGRLLIVSFIERGDVFRFISDRMADANS